EPEVEGGDEPARLGPDDAYAGIARGDRGEELGASVGRAVVHGDELEGHVALLEDARDGLFERLLRISIGEDDRELGTNGHGGTLPKFSEDRDRAPRLAYRPRMK